MGSNEELYRRTQYTSPLPDGSYKNYYYIFKNKRYDGIIRDVSGHISIKESEIDAIVGEIMQPQL